MPQVDQPGGLHQRLVAGGQEQAVADGPGPAARAAHALEEARHGGGAVDLDHPVQVAHVDAQFQDARGHDHAVVPVGEGVFRLPPLLLAERAVGDEGRDAQLPQPSAQFLRPGTAIDEDQPLLAPVQPGDDHGRVLQRADVVQLDLGLRAAASAGRNTTRSPCAGPGQPVDEHLRVPDRRRQPDPLKLPAGQPRDPLEDREQVPAAVVSGEGMDLVHDHRPQVARTVPRESTFGETSINSSDSGVVSRQSGGSRSTCRRAVVVTSPCQRADRRPNSVQYRWSRTSRLLSRALIGQM